MTHPNKEYKFSGRDIEILAGRARQVAAAKKVLNPIMIALVETSNITAEGVEMLAQALENVGLLHPDLSHYVEGPRRN